MKQAENKNSKKPYRIGELAALYGMSKKTFNVWLTPKSTDPLFLLLGIQFYQIINSIEYPFNDLSFNALSIVKIDAE